MKNGDEVVLAQKIKGCISNELEELASSDANLVAFENATSSEMKHAKIKPPRRLVWSTDTVDLADPFQRKWYIQQTLTHGRAEDIGKQLKLPLHLQSRPLPTGT